MWVISWILKVDAVTRVSVPHQKYEDPGPNEHADPDQYPDYNSKLTENF